MNNSVNQFYGHDNKESCRIREMRKRYIFKLGVPIGPGFAFGSHRAWECKICAGYVYSQHKINVNEQTSDIRWNMLSTTISERSVGAAMFRANNLIVRLNYSRVFLY